MARPIIMDRCFSVSCYLFSVQPSTKVQTLQYQSFVDHACLNKYDNNVNQLLDTFEIVGHDQKEDLSAVSAAPFCRCR